MKTDVTIDGQVQTEVTGDNSDSRQRYEDRRDTGRTGADGGNSGQ